MKSWIVCPADIIHDPFGPAFIKQIRRSIQGQDQVPDVRIAGLKFPFWKSISWQAESAMKSELGKNFMDSY
jgi:hypothetical protein